MKCSQKTCEKEAGYWYFWPGEPGPTYACAEHMALAVGLMAHMGVHLMVFSCPAIEPEAGKPRDEVASEGVTDAERQALME
jgi:hypothetical protein